MASQSLFNPGAAIKFIPEEKFAVKQIDLGLFGVGPKAGPSIGPTPLPTPAPTPAPTPTPTTAATSTSDLQILISNVPVAQEGHVISSDYHNSLRQALLAMASQMGIGPVLLETKFTTTARLLSRTGKTAWDLDYGVAKTPAGAAADATVSGWLEVDLPDGARIKSMTVFAKKIGAGGKLEVKLRRQSTTNPTTAADLITVTIAESADVKASSSEISIPGLGPAALEEFAIVDNGLQNYLITAEFTVAANVTAEINAIQIVCRHS